MKFNQAILFTIAIICTEIDCTINYNNVIENSAKIVNLGAKNCNISDLFNQNFTKQIEAKMMPNATDVVLIVYNNCTYIITKNTEHDIEPFIVIILAIISMIFIIVLATKIQNFMETHGGTTTKQTMHKYQRLSWA